jgi:L,D-peptidoglycan transpeptidase YkuD (ErfK/YbiS/YcfS/YnhG family)
MDTDGDWTDGCIAVSNHAMDRIWRLVHDGTLVIIKP